MTNSYIEQRKPLLLCLIAIWTVSLIVSGIRPYDQLTWLMEVMPAILGMIVMLWTWRRFPLTTLLYILILLHSLILMLGGHYTYARTPVGEWWREWFGLQRNNYDRFGHIAQGFFPAFIAREILLRLSPLKAGGWLNFLTVTVCMAISVTYEFIEWWAALLLGGSAEEFLATQGDIWDTQWDMFLCTLGALGAVFLFGRIHDKMIAGLQQRVQSG